MRIDSDITHDYVYEATLFNQRTSFTQMSDYFNIMMEQATLILEVASYDAVTEDAGVAAAKGIKKAGSKVASGLKKFIEFIKNMFNRFLEFITTLFKNNEKWLIEREKDFSSMNYKGLSVNVVPYWEGDPLKTVQAISGDLGNMVNDYSLLDASKPLSDDEMKIALEKTDPAAFLGQYATGGDHVDGIKNIMRVGNKDGKDSIELGDNNLKSRIIKNFIPIVKDHKKIVDDTKKVFNLNESTLTKIDAAISKRSTSTTESFLLMGEKLSVSEASLFYPVIEAEINADDNKDDKPKQQENSNSKDSTHGNTKVEVNKTSQVDKEADEAIDNTSTNTLKIARNYSKCSNIILGACLTVLEERMSVSINVLKAVHSSANTRHGRKGNTEGKE